MCGFAGEFFWAAMQADGGRARLMASRLRHRGPDEESSFASSDGRCAIAFRRLSVIDPAGSHQPMNSSDGKVTIAFNGEIYNFRQLQAELRQQGVVLQTAGDTEVVLQEYLRSPGDLASRLTGMFALAIYDSRNQQLLLARDRLGEKPLFYARLAGGIAFASEPKALLANPLILREIDQLALQHYLSLGYIPGPLTIWKSIRKLPPASVLSISAAGEQHLDRYWQLESLELQDDDSQLIERVRNEVTDAVRRTMVSDVPLGALLSGGLDSSIVVAVMSKVAGRAGGVKTFTAGFADRRFDERGAARRVADHCRTDHTELLVEASPQGAVERILEMYDEPFGDSSALPTALICQAARQHVTVALAGDGGDEVFGGYDRYRAMAIAENSGTAKTLAAQALATLLGPLASRDERSRLRRFIRFSAGLAYPFAEQYFMYRRLFGPQDLCRLLSDASAQHNDLASTQQWFCDLYEEGDWRDELTRSQRHDLLTYLPDDLLVKTDRASMSSSLELRAPLLDHNLVRLGLSLPWRLKISGRRGKWILRQAFARDLPAEVFVRGKLGFGVPLGRWLREELRGVLVETLMDRRLAEMNIFRPEALAGLINDHLSGRDDHRHRLWALLVLARWLLSRET